MEAIFKEPFIAEFGLYSVGLRGTQKPVMQRTAFVGYAFSKDHFGSSLADGSKNWAAGMKTKRPRDVYGHATVNMPNPV